MPALGRPGADLRAKVGLVSLSRPGKQSIPRCEGTWSCRSSLTTFVSVIFLVRRCPNNEWGWKLIFQQEWKQFHQWLHWWCYHCPNRKKNSKNKVKLRGFIRQVRVTRCERIIFSLSARDCGTRSIASVRDKRMTTTALSSSFSRNRRTERLFFRFDYGQDRKTTRKSSHYLVFDFFCNDRHRVFFCWPFSTWQSLEPTWKRSSMEGFIKLDSFTPEILDGDQKGPTQSYFPRKRAFLRFSNRTGFLEISFPQWEQQISRGFHFFSFFFETLAAYEYFKSTFPSNKQSLHSAVS